MNQTAKCHQIQDCSGLYIDAFRAFKSKINDIDATFILTHYHSDHYSGLPRGKAYYGPALIHCTPTTAELLEEVHGIDPKFIVAHPYGCTWTLGSKSKCKVAKKVPDDNDIDERGEVGLNMNDRVSYSSNSNNTSNISESSNTSSHKNEGNIRITFYDANHCPGAAIIHVHIVNRDKHHIHTGDMRFHRQKFSTYPLINDAINQRKIDLLYLDTTYSKPRHDFIPQDEAINMIASSVKALLKDNHDIVAAKKKNFFQPKSVLNSHSEINCSSSSSSRSNSTNQRTLVLLSCYSIGKEKVLWHSAVESSQKVYVNKTKYKMLQCIQCDQDYEAASRSRDESCNIFSKCTTNPHESDIHVIQMGLAGSLHPFFKPNYEQVALYAHELNKGYSKVVAFIPTGWAISSKFNKENAISSKRIPMTDLKDLLPERTARKGCYGNDSSILVEIRLIPYSEHSSYSELRSCVEFFKPRQIIPTVFPNEKEYSAIENRFRDLVDSNRAKASFIRMIAGGESSSSSSKNEQNNVQKSRKRKRNVAASSATKDATSTIKQEETVSANSTIKNPYLSSTSKKSNSSSSSRNSTLKNPYQSSSFQKPNISTTSTAKAKKRKTTAVSLTESTPCCMNQESMKTDENSQISTPRKGGFVLKKKGSTKKKLLPQPFCLDEEKAAVLQSMGFDHDSAKLSLKAKRNNMEQALELLLKGKIKNGDFV